MDVRHASFASQNVIEVGAVEAMALRKRALIAFPFNRRSEQKNKIIAFKNNLRRTAQFAGKQISTLAGL